MGNLLGIGTYFSFAQESYFLKATNLTNYLNVLWIKKNNWEKDWILDLWILQGSKVQGPRSKDFH
jgi:hypothetical protein